MQGFVFVASAQRQCHTQGRRITVNAIIQSHIREREKGVKRATRKEKRGEDSDRERGGTRRRAERQNLKTFIK